MIKEDMKMNGIGGYQIYQNDFVRSMTQDAYDKKAREADKTGTKDVNDKKETGKVKNSPAALSDNAQDLLERLKKKYGNMDFIVADFDSDEEAQKYLAGGTKEYSVLIDPELLEEMAADESVEKKYTGMIDEATTKLSDMKEQLGDDEENVVHMGVSFGKDGSVSYFAELEKSGEKQRERIEKSKADKKEKEKKNQTKMDKKLEEEKRLADLAEKTKRVRVSASSAEGLLDKIRNVDWDKVEAQRRTAVGGIIDYNA